MDYNRLKLRLFVIDKTIEHAQSGFEDDVRGKHMVKLGKDRERIISQIKEKLPEWAHKENLPT